MQTVNLQTTQQTMNSIILKGVRIYAYHGVLEQERKVGAYFTIDLKILTDFSRAMETDELDGTISYADVYDVVKQEMAVPSKLLEHVGGRIISSLRARFKLNKVYLRIMKENPPMGADLQAAGIEIED